MGNEPFEIKTRGWKDWPEALAEDSVQGEWEYIPTTALLDELRKNPSILVDESEEGIKLKGLVCGKAPDAQDYYLLSGRREDWHDDYKLEKFEVVKKVNSVREWSGHEKTFDRPQYIDYGVIGLYTSQHQPLMTSEVVRAAGIVNALVVSVKELAKEYLQDRI